MTLSCTCPAEDFNDARDRDGCRQAAVFRHNPNAAPISPPCGERTTRGSRGRGSLRLLYGSESPYGRRESTRCQPERTDRMPRPTATTSARRCSPSRSGTPARRTSSIERPPSSMADRCGGRSSPPPPLVPQVRGCVIMPGKSDGYHAWIHHDQPVRSAYYVLMMNNILGQCLGGRLADNIRERQMVLRVQHVRSDHGRRAAGGAPVDPEERRSRARGHDEEVRQLGAKGSRLSRSPKRASS